RCSLLFLSFLSFFTLLVLLMPPSAVAGGSPESTSTLELIMRPDNPGVEGYYCTYVALPKEESYIVGYEPKMKAGIAHHMLLFGCQNVDETEGRTWL
uniref:Copper type II ascorbate-dependent monooxygenase N-terminal domain-containing protein n=1 Tax=Amphimedon queenslandica TaxID=400682 RepID=A0A1X7U7F5_AMPQE